MTVLGDTSFLGRRVVRHLRNARETVRFASRHPGPDELQDRRLMEAAVAGVDGVVNAVSVYVEHGNHIRIASTAKAGQRRSPSNPIGNALVAAMGEFPPATEAVPFIWRVS